jgi:hypothetical protein
MLVPSPLSSRGLGRRILSPETGVRIPVAVLHESLANAGFSRFGCGLDRKACPETRSEVVLEAWDAMQRQATRAISRHVFKVERKRGAQWYAKYRRSCFMFPEAPSTS